MDPVYSLLIAWLMSSAALGVGSSTITIISFLVAIGDGQIDTSERRMLGVVYKALRAATVMIGVALLCLGVFYPGVIASQTFLWILLAVLIINAGLMTKHWITPKIGPAFQAATWYTVGFVLAIEAFELTSLTPTTFTALYVADIVLAILIVNGLMIWLQKKRNTQLTAPK